MINKLPIDPTRLTHLKDKGSRKLLIQSLEYINRHASFLATYHARPKFTRDIGTWAEPQIAREPTAIVMQGPIATSDDFTIETLELYARHRPDVRMILSTWSDTDPDLLERVRATGAETVLCEKPTTPGLFNINMQMVSAGAGVRRAVELGVDWVLKTRTDQRLYEPDVLSYLATLAKTFPVRGGFDQKHRVVAVGQGSLKYVPYHVTDQTVFGHASDMLRYWTPALRLEPAPAHWPSSISEVYTQTKIGELIRAGTPECYFAAQFLAATGREVDWTVRDTWEAYRDQFCFADYTSTGFYWVKSQTWTKREHTVEYGTVTNRREMDFREWLLLYTEALPIEAAARYEDVMDTYFMEPLPVRDPRR